MVMSRRADGYGHRPAGNANQLQRFASMGAADRSAAPSAPASPPLPFYRTGWARLAVEHSPLLLIISLVLVGFFLAPDFGLSWDEPDNAAFARQALEAYRSLQAPSEWHSNLESKGPFFVALAEALSRVLLLFPGSWMEVSARHFTYFLSFPLAIVALHGLARRMVGAPSALAATVLFATQPLLFGHAFINPKDTPFLAFFLLSVWAGVWMTEGRRQVAPGRGSLPFAIPVAAGVVLGMTTSIRLFGPFAGLLVSGLAWVRWRRRALMPLALYWGAAALTTYVTWPYLWGNPLGRLVESLRVMLDFPWDNLVLYRGLVYPVEQLPWHYLPFTTLIQLTEPVGPLALIGGLAGLVGMVRDRMKRPLYLLVFLWSAIPFASAILADSEVYDNSRQFLFALPPLFLAAALGFEALAVLRPRWLGPAVAGIALLPGLIGIARLHPYEYIYYNQIVGGVPGAYRRYELDYWATSYRAAMEALNGFAREGAAVEVAGPWQSAASFARPDLDVFKSGTERDAGAQPPDYLIVLTRSNWDQGRMPEAPTVIEIRVADAVLAVVRYIRPNS